MVGEKNQLNLYFLHLQTRIIVYFYQVYQLYLQFIKWENTSLRIIKITQKDVL